MKISQLNRGFQTFSKHIQDKSEIFGRRESHQRSYNLHLVWSQWWVWDRLAPPGKPPCPPPPSGRRGRSTSRLVAPARSLLTPTPLPSLPGSSCFHVVFTCFGWHSSPTPLPLGVSIPHPHCSPRLPKSPLLLPLTTNQHDCRRPTVLLRRVPSPHPPLKSPICSAMPCRARSTTVHGQRAQVSGKPGEVRRSGAPCLKRPPTPVWLMLSPDF